MAGTSLKGNCYLCGKAFSKAAFKNHILTNHVYKEADSQDCVILKVEGAEDKNYWLYIDVSITATLKTIDTFLRNIWLECCGHMSAFYSRSYEEIGKSNRVAIFPAGSVLLYEYDFGDTTSLKITVVAHTSRPKQRKAVRLLGRNEPYSFICGKCGKSADVICCECKWDDKNPFLCDTCAECHEHESMLPVTNSPRMGVCGYCGEFDIYDFDPIKCKGE